MKDLNEVALELIQNASTNCINDSESVVNILTPWGKKLQIQVSVIDSEESEFNDFPGIPTENFKDLAIGFN